MSNNVKRGPVDYVYIDRTQWHIVRDTQTLTGQRVVCRVFMYTKARRRLDIVNFILIT